LVENRIGRMARARILRHAADCVSCRRQLAIAALTPIGPLRAALEPHLTSGRLTVAAGLLLGFLVLGILSSGSSEDPQPRMARSPARPSRPMRVSTPRELPGHQPGRGSPASAGSEVPSPETEDPRPLFPASEPSGLDPSPTSPSSSTLDLTPASVPHRLDSVAEGPASPLQDPKVVESETMGRLAILDPFGSLALEGAGGRSPVLGSRVVPVEARLTAVGRASGFRLGDGLRVQLSPGSAVSVFQNLTRRCAGLAILQGALLMESSQPQSVYLRREGSAGTVEGMTGPVLVNAGSRADSLTVTPLGGAGAVWRRSGQAPVDIACGESLGIDANGQESGGKGPKPKPSLARFVGWPEPASLFYSNFEDDVQGMERPVLVQGVARDGVVAGVAGVKGRKTIELTLPVSIPTLPAEATLRLRVRTTAVRIQCALGSNLSRAVPVTVTQRNRSETAWTTVSVGMSAFDQDGHRSRGGRAGFHGNLTFVAEAPSRVSAEDLVFDLDEIEISRS
jgi:hypothetical protein